jgi:chromosome segregation ATPase
MAKKTKSVGDKLENDLPTLEAQLKSMQAGLTTAIRELGDLEASRPQVSAAVYVHGDAQEKLETLHADIVRLNKVIGGLHTSVAELQAKMAARDIAQIKESALTTSGAEDEATAQLARVDATLADLARRRIDVESEGAELAGLKPALQAAGLVGGDESALKRLEDLDKRQQVLSDTLSGIDHAAAEAAAERIRAEAALKQAQLQAGAAKVRAAGIRRVELLEEFKTHLAAAGEALEDLGALCAGTFSTAKLLEADAQARGERLPEDLQPGQFVWLPFGAREASGWTAKLIGRTRGPYGVHLEDAERARFQMRL